MVEVEGSGRVGVDVHSALRGEGLGRPMAGAGSALASQKVVAASFFRVCPRGEHVLGV